MAETIFVDCPHCGIKMEVEKATGKVIKTWDKVEKKAGGDPMADALKKIREDKAKLDSYFKAAPDSLKQHQKELESKFKEETDKIKKEGGKVEKPINPFDLD